MTCPHASDSTGRDDNTQDSRREFMKAALAIGGSSALSACARRSGRTAGTTTAEFPRGPEDLSTLPERQHAWARYTPQSKLETSVFPRHQAFIFLNYTGGSPTENQRSQVEATLQALERAFQRGTGPKSDVLENEGLLFTLGYSRQYFDRFDQPPAGVTIHSPQELLTALNEDPNKADGFDAALHLASGYAQIILAAEEALFGEVDMLNGYPVDADFCGIFERADRRTGAVGNGHPHDNIDSQIPERSPASMGFKSSFSDTFPQEDAATIQDGPFAGGTTQQVSRLVIDVDNWYDQDHSARVTKMFGSEFDSEKIGEVGEKLGSKIELTEEDVVRTVDDARANGRVGHAQKTARARNNDFTPQILRRGDFTAPDEEGAVLHFGSIQDTTKGFVETRRAMDDLAYGAGDSEGADAPDIAPENDGILGYIDVTNRATFLIPPRKHRALPESTPPGK